MSFFAVPKNRIFLFFYNKKRQYFYKTSSTIRAHIKTIKFTVSKKPKIKISHFNTFKNKQERDEIKNDNIYRYSNYRKHNNE